MQHQFKVTQVDQKLMQALSKSEPTAYYAAMVFQLGCSIGELVGMGVTPDQLAEACEQLIIKACERHAVSVDTKGLDGQQQPAL